MNDENENLKSGKNADDTMRVTRLNGVPLDLRPDAYPGAPSPAPGRETAISRLAKRLDKANDRGEDLAPGQAIREACPELFSRSGEKDL